MSIILKNDNDNLNKSSNENNIMNETDKNKQLDKLLLDLKIISNIKEFDKLKLGDTIEIDTPHFLQSLTRKYSGDSREKTIEYIEKTIANIFSVLDNLLEDEIKKLKPISILHVNNKSPYYLNNNLNIKKYNFKEETVSIYQKINQNLSESISGLQNLKITYLNDISTSAKLDMIIIKIQNRINKINNMMVLNP